LSSSPTNDDEHTRCYSSYAHNYADPHASSATGFCIDAGSLNSAFGFNGNYADTDAYPLLTPQSHCSQASVIRTVQLVWQLALISCRAFKKLSKKHPVTLLLTGAPPRLPPSTTSLAILTCGGGGSDRHQWYFLAPTYYIC
jgi:hypothetical protein